MSVYYLVKRNMLLYFKDKAAVFFSLLSVFIILMLMVVFLGSMNQDNLLQALQQFSGKENSAADIEHAKHLVLMWTIAGMLATNTFTVPTTIMGTYIQDKQYHRLESFFCAPISRTKLLLGYLLSAILTGLIMSIIMLGFSYGYMTSQGLGFLSFTDLGKVLVLLVFCVTSSSCMLLLVAQWVKTSNAWGSFSTISGTLIGFLGGIYLPLSMLPEAVQTVLKSLPFLHQASALRSVFTQSAATTTFQELPEAALTYYRQAMGIQIELFDTVITIPMQLLLLCICGIITLAIAVYLLRKHTSFDR